MRERLEILIFKGFFSPQFWIRISNLGLDLGLGLYFPS